MPVDTIDYMAERAIRNYLLFLEDPRQLIDEGQIEVLRKKAQSTVDPIERLRIYEDLERAQSTDDSRYRLEFVLHAKSWAAANDVGAAAFRHLGVSDDVLRSAGLLGSAPAARSGRRRDPSVRTSVSADLIKDHVRSLRGTFTMADVQSKVGGSPMTVRKGVQALVDDGTISRLGPMRGWAGRGRAPIVFEVRSRK